MVPEPTPSRQRTGIIRGFIQVIGELVMTAGLIVLLFVAWELWFTNVQADATQQQAIKGFAKTLSGPTAPAPAAGPLPATTGPGSYGDPVVAKAPGYGEMIGLMYIPRLGKTYTRPIIQGTSVQVLDTLGLGHYNQTAMPGSVGNFALAGHRQTHGAVLDAIDTLVPGDELYVQTKDGYYTYVFRNHEIVLPARIDVLLPVPTQPKAQPTERLLTLTSCNPRFGSQERIIAYSVMEYWQPASAGPPAAIAAEVAAVQAQNKQG
ncbi:MAG: class E sortase [Actinomycetota bacterium]|nr:class E sortase [Actinomycetota bacterium]